MRLRSCVLFLGSVFIATGCLARSGGAPSPKNADRDQAALVQAAQHFLRVFDNLEWDAFDAAWSSSRSVFFPFRDTPERVEGADVAARFRRFFDEVKATRPGPPYLRLQPQALRAEVRGDAGLVTFTLGRRPGDVGRRTLLFVRESGQWKLAHMHASTALAEDP
jgi:hypothetical protein